MQSKICFDGSNLYLQRSPKTNGCRRLRDILSHIMETYFSEPNEDNVSDDIMEALMKSVIRNLRAAIKDPKDSTARSNLMWDSTMAENRIIKMGKSATSNVTIWNISWEPTPIATMDAAWQSYTQFITLIFTAMGFPNLFGLRKMSGAFPATENLMRHWPKRALKLWQILLRRSASPTTLRELGMTDRHQLKEIADSCGISAGSYKK